MRKMIAQSNPMHAHRTAGLIDIDAPSALLGGSSPRRFMRTHWQKRPLLVRRAFEAAPPVSRAQLFALAARDDVESRLVVQGARGSWTLRRGPLPRRVLPPLAQRRWTLLVQGLDLHVPAAHELLAQFRFVPDARLDDLMVSYATDGGGVGPHFDSYDVFLLQVHGVRRWRIGRLADPRLREDVPLKILSNFVPEQEWRLEPGDLLYLPPRWAHDGVAEGECMTCSVGFRAPGRDELARELAGRLADTIDEPGPLYRDPSQAAVGQPARVPDALAAFASSALRRLADDRDALAIALGEYLSEPKQSVWFEAGAPVARGRGVTLDARTRMIYDERHLFVNGEAYRAGGRDARLLRSLADTRRLDARSVAALGGDARSLLDRWAEAGWLHASGDPTNDDVRDDERARR